MCVCVNSSLVVHLLVPVQALCDYLLYTLNNPRKALELAAEATRVVEYKDWWWKARLGKCYYKLGMYRDAEKQVWRVVMHVIMVAVGCFGCGDCAAVAVTMLCSCHPVCVAFTWLVVSLSCTRTPFCCLMPVWRLCSSSPR